MAEENRRKLKVGFSLGAVALTIGLLLGAARINGDLPRVGAPVMAQNQTTYSSDYFQLRYDNAGTTHRAGLSSHNYFEEGVNTNFTLEWDNNDSTSFYIKANDSYINANTNKNEIVLVDKDDALKWSIVNQTIKQGEKYLYYNPSSPRVSAYSVKTNYPIAYFYTPAEYDAGSHCNWSQFTQDCLRNICYTTSEPEQSSSSSEPPTSSSESTVDPSEQTASETVDFTSQDYTNQQTITSYSGVNFSVTFNKGSNNNPPKYYTNGTAIRCYGGNHFTISSASTITQIKLTFGSSDGSNAIMTNCGTYTSGTWTGESTTITFTIDGTSGNRRIQAIKVTF